jgi:hypothetical protein
VRAQQVGQFQDVGRPILLPLERAEFLGRRADPISARGGSQCLEETGFQACFPLGGLASILAALGFCLTSILSTLFLVALFPISGLLLLLLEKLQECRHL